MPGGVGDGPCDWDRLVSAAAGDVRRVSRLALALSESDPELRSPGRPGMASLASRLDATARGLDVLRSG